MPATRTGLVDPTDPAGTAAMAGTAAKADPSVPAVAPRDGRDPGRTVLVVEDDGATAELERRVLARVGLHVRLAGSVGEAVRLLQRGPFDAVLLDYQLPDGDPWPVVEAAAARLPRVPVVLVTAMGSERVAVEALHRGVADYVRKAEAFWEQLPDAVTRVVRVARAEDALRESEARRLKAQQRRAEQAEQLAAIVAQVGAATDAEQALLALLRGAVALLNGEGGLAHLFAPVDAPAAAAATPQGPAGQDGQARLTLRVDQGGTVIQRETGGALAPDSFGAAIAAGHPAVLVPDLYAPDPLDSPPRRRPGTHGVRALVVVPIAARGQIGAGGHDDAAGESRANRPIGSLHVNHRRAGFFSPTDLALATALASQAAAVIERVRLQGALRESEARYRRLAENAPDATFWIDLPKPPQ